MYMITRKLQPTATHSNVRPVRVKRLWNQTENHRALSPAQLSSQTKAKYNSQAEIYLVSKQF